MLNKIVAAVAPTSCGASLFSMRGEQNEKDGHGADNERRFRGIEPVAEFSVVQSAYARSEATKQRELTDAEGRKENKKNGNSVLVCVQNDGQNKSVNKRSQNKESDYQRHL